MNPPDVAERHAVDCILSPPPPLCHESRIEWTFRMYAQLMRRELEVATREAALQHASSNNPRPPRPRWSDCEE